MIWHVGPYNVVILGDSVSVTDMDEPLDMDDQSGWALPETTVKGLGKHVAKGVGLRLVRVYDMDIIYVIQKGHKYGWSYAINLTEPAFSEWGDTGVIVLKDE